MKQGIPRKKPISQLIITVRIVPGKTSEHQKRLMRAFWTHQIAECKGELQAERKAKTIVGEDTKNESLEP